MIVLDGSFGEGGGQIVRTALALSALTGKAFTINHIRKGRAQSGLKHQHLHCIKALEKLCGGKASGSGLGSDAITFTPGQIKGKTISIDIGTAGSISLLLQAVLLPAIFADTKVRLKITGGTDGKWAMPIDYFHEVFVPHLRKYAEVTVKLVKRGYFPKGGGKVDILIKPRFKVGDFPEMDSFLHAIKERGVPFKLHDQGSLVSVKGVSHASRDLEKAEVAERQAKCAKITLMKLNAPISIRTEYSDALSTGSGIVLWANFSTDLEEIDLNNPIKIGADALGEKGKRAEIVGNESAKRLLTEISFEAPVDEYLSDNLIPFLALFGGTMKVAKISKHALTNIYVCENFLGKIFKVDKEARTISV